MADRNLQDFNKSMHKKHVQRTNIPEVPLFNANYHPSIIPDTSLTNNIYRPVQRNTLPNQNDLHGTGVPHATLNFNSTGQSSAPYYTNNSSLSETLVPTTVNHSRFNFNDSGIGHEYDLNNNWSFSSIPSTNIKRDQYLNLPETVVTLQLGNLDTTADQASLRQYLISKLQPITPILSFTFEGVIAKVCLPSMDHAKQVVSYLHRKKVGHKRITVSYTKDCSSLDPSTLECQVAGLLKDIPNYSLSLYKLRELFQSRFKASISVGNLCAMNEICTVTENGNERSVTLRPELIQSIERGEFNELFLQTIPNCHIHFKKVHRGWAEQEIEPLPNVWMSVSEIRSILFSLTQKHIGNIPIASLLHCIKGELQYNIVPNERGVNLEHLISCVNQIQITTNKFGIKILKWCEDDGTKSIWSDDGSRGQSISRCLNIADANGKFSSEVVDLLTSCPKSTMKFARFIPLYHNTFGRQCRVADFGYVKLIDLFEAIPRVVQVMGEGENRLITLTHQYQMRRLAVDLSKIIRGAAIKTVRLSDIPVLLSSSHKKFEITDYGVCYLNDIVEALQENNLIMFDMTTRPDDAILSLPKRRPPSAEQKKMSTDFRKISVFAAETIELLKNGAQYTIAYEKFSCSYHYHFAYQLRLSDYGQTKLADMMEGLAGIVRVDFSNEEHRKICLHPKVAQRVFSEQLKTIVGECLSFLSIYNVLDSHMKTFGYQIKPETLGFENIWDAMKSLPFVEILTRNNNRFMIFHHDDDVYLFKSQIILVLLDSLTQQSNSTYISMRQLINGFFEKCREELTESLIESMNHLIDINIENNIKFVGLSSLALFILQIVRILKSVQSITVSRISDELNTKLNSSNAVFQFGYPDVKSLIKSFPDIFLINDDETIMFNKSSIFAICNENLNTQPKVTSPPNNNGVMSAMFYGTQDPNLKFSNSAMSRVLYSELETNSLRRQFNEEVHAGNISSHAMESIVSQVVSNDSPISRKESHFANNEFVSPSPTRRNLKRSYHEACLNQSEDNEHIISSKIPTMKSLSLNFDSPDSSKNLAEAAIPDWMNPVWCVSSSPPGKETEPFLISISIPELKIYNNQDNIDTPTMMKRLSSKFPEKFNFDKP